KNNLDIYDVPIAQITQEYLSYIDIMKELNLDVAGEFLVMASTLMQIKARMLLPSHEAAQEEGPDPWAELAEKISEYEKYKNVSKFLDSQFDQFKDVFYRGSPAFSDSERVLNVEFFELLEAVRRAFTNIKEDATLVESEQFPIEVKMEKILNLLSERPWVLIDEIFGGEKRRAGVVTCFLALLELMKLKKIISRQDKPLGEIRIYLRPEPALA
ncbi:MAG: segregation/condensation protein A, partial [Elusimicrobia bacterium]|nr:segregation/condensation protein A [Elusimicrobiota bacterium]